MNLLKVKWNAAAMRGAGELTQKLKKKPEVISGIIRIHIVISDH